MAGLDTTTINRLLRPLRTRCNVLSKMVSTQSKLSTYASSRRASAVLETANHHDLPLAVYPPPDKSASKAHFSQSYKDNLELIRRIYAVRDAFRNIIARVPASDPIPSLSTLCALVIGRNMHGWERQPEHEEDEPESDLFVDQMYEAVPMSSRNSLLSSHALGIILNTCPHHLTLISILLDETLTHKLDHEATQLLEALLLVAYRPKPNGVAPVCHNAHSKFVTELLERWLNAGYTTLAFTTVLIRVLCEVQNKDIWTSRAMDNLLRRLYHLDVSSFLCVTTELANHLSSRRTLRRQSILKDQGTEELSDLSHCLCQWYRYAIERLCASSKEDVVSSYNDAIFEFIQTSTFVLALETTSAPTALKDSLASLALIWLSGNHDTAPLTHLQRVTDLLSSYKPQPSTFHELVKQTFSGKPIGDTRQRLRIWASCLRKHKLNTLEASLWGSTLFAVENLEGDIHLVPHERAEVKAYRQQVMEYVDEAESNLFQAPSCTPMRSATKSYSPLRDYPTVPQSPWSKGGWKWEPVVGSWVKQHNPSRPSPSAEMAVKRRRVTFATPKKISSALTWDTPDTGSCTSLTPRPKFRPRYTPRHEKKLPSLSLSTSSTNFTSIVAKAVSQRTVLHPVDINERRRSLVEDSGGHWESSPIAPRRLKGHHPEPHQASDDVLDLLASPSTSPTRPW